MTSLIASSRLEMALSRDAFSSLGVAVDRLNLSQVIERVSELILVNSIDQRPKLVATININILASTVGHCNKRAQMVRLLTPLRRAELVLADGYPIELLSRVMKSPIRSVVARVDLVLELVRQAAYRNWSVVILGRNSNVTEAAIEKLRRVKPGLCIEGFSSTGGPALKGSLPTVSDDAKLVAEINASGADILLIGLEDVSQLLWFERHRHALKVPVSICVGDALDTIVARSRRVPEWAQRMRINRFYRSLPNLRSYWEDSVKGMLKLAPLAAPLLWIRLLEIVYVPKRYQPMNWKTLWSSREDTIQTVQLPRVVTKSNLHEVLLRLRDKSGRLLLIDMQNVKHVELSAYFSLVEIGRLFAEGIAKGMLLNLGNRVQRRLQAGRILEVCAPNMTESPDVVHSLGTLDALSVFCRSYVLDGATLVYLGGAVSATTLKTMGFGICLEKLARDRVCIVDLRNVARIDSALFIYLFRCIKVMSGSENKICLSGLNRRDCKVLENSGLSGTFKILSDKQLADQLFSTT